MQPNFLMFWFSSYPVFSECHHFIKIQYSNERAAVLKQRQVLDKIKKSFFSQNEIYHATDFSDLVSFQVSECSPYSMNSAEVHIWNHEKLHKNNGKCLRNSRKWLFLKIRFIMQLRFLILWFSSVLVFSVLYYWNKNPCFNAQAVAQKQLKMLENWKISFFQNEIYYANEQLSFLRLTCQGLGALVTGTCWLPATHVKSSARDAP